MSASKQKRFLIVEDEFICRKLLVKVLSQYGKCDTASSGEEGVNAFCNALEQNNPYDLVTLDIVLPGMSGHDVLKKVREMERRKNIREQDGVRVVMTTALDEHEDEQLAKNAGCRAYIVKPISKDKLLKDLRRIGVISDE